MTIAIRVLYAAAMTAALTLSHSVTSVQARDDGRYAQSPLKPWFDSLKSRKGFCCSVADGEDTEYEMRTDGYWAPIDGAWQRVPEDAVIKEPNRVGRAMKWIVIENGEKKFRCFLPASGV